jgi:hypothetical protein
MCWLMGHAVDTHGWRRSRRPPVTKRREDRTRPQATIDDASNAEATGGLVEIAPQRLSSLPARDGMS